MRVAGMTEEAPREWSHDQLQDLAGTVEMSISAPHIGETPRTWLPIWVVVVEDEVFVRTWRRRRTGWYGRAVELGQAWIRISGEPIRVIVTDVGSRDSDTVDHAYRTKYGAGASTMVDGEAVASTLRLTIA